MAKISAGILSTPRGKVAGVVGASWKGVGYIREKVKPANPKTAAQEAQRSKMRNCVHFAQLILADVLIPFVSPFQKHQSGYNWFVKQNIKNFTYDFPKLDDLKLTAGTLQAPTTTATEDGGTFLTSFSVDANPAGEGETLKACVLVTDYEAKRVYFGSADYTGNSASVSIEVPDYERNVNTFVYVWNALEKTGLKTRDVSTSVVTDLG